MALTRDQQRLFKIDAQIIDLRYLYEREKMREIELGKTTILMSRVFKNRLEAAERVRTKLAKALRDNPSQRKTYEIELKRRLEARDNAHEELQKLLLRQKDLITYLLLNPANEQQQEDLLQCNHEIPIQKRRVTACERSYNSWAAKEESVPVKKLENKLPRGYDVNVDIEAIYGSMPIDQEVVNAINKNLTAKDILGSAANWDTNKAVNNANLDMLTNPDIKDKPVEMTEEELKDIEIQKLQNELARLQRKPIVLDINSTKEQKDESVD